LPGFISSSSAAIFILKNELRTAENATETGFLLEKHVDQPDHIPSLKDIPLILLSRQKSFQFLYILHKILRRAERFKIETPFKNCSFAGVIASGNG
jgi:hypothetical protein